MAFDTKKWLIEDLGFSEEKATALLPEFDGERATKLEKGYLRQSDYSRSMNDLQKSQTDLAAANDRLNNEMAEWATLTASEKSQSTKLRSDLEKSQADVLRLTQTVARVATDAGLDPAKVLEGTAVVPPKKEDPAVDLSGYVKADQFNAINGQLAEMALTLPAELGAIAYEHQQLFGKHLDTREIVKELKARAGTKGNQKSLDPRAIWEETHKVPDQRATVEKTRFDEAIAAAEARGREAALSESSIPGAPPQGRHAPIFQRPDRSARESVLKRAQPGTSVNSAVAALRSHKYAVPIGTKTA